MNPSTPAKASLTADLLVADLTNAFLQWPLPHSVCADGCATKQQDGRVGTNLMSFIEARQMMIQVVLPRIEGYLPKPDLVKSIDPVGEFDSDEHAKSTAAKPAPAIASEVGEFMHEALKFAGQCWTDKETSHKTMDVELATAFAKRLAGWMSTAAEFSRSVDFYRGLLTKCGEIIGREAYTSDDGSVQQDVLALKIPEIVQRMVNNAAKNQMPAPPEGMALVGEYLVIKDSDHTHRRMSRDYILAKLKECDDAREKMLHLEHEANRRNPSRFLPEVIKRLETAACAAIDKNDDGRAEAYAMAATLIRANLHKD